MKSLLPLGASLLALPLAAHAQAQPQVSLYLQPSVVAVFLGSNIQDTVGGSVAVGTSFYGPNAIEASFASFDTHMKGDSTDTFKFEQFLASYQYEVPASARVSFHIGASIGVTQERRNFEVDYMAPFGVISYNLSDHALTYGVHGDVAYHFIHNFSAVLGANLLGLSQTAITTGGSMTQLSLGLNFRF
jgi:hypothetical protein